MNGRFTHNCTDCERQIPAVLDGELGNVMQSRFLSQIEQCPRCHAKYQREKSFRVFLKTKTPKIAPSKNLLANIRSSIRGVTQHRDTLRK